jgi:quercetin dioxygenase-like cupin family protein
MEAKLPQRTEKPWGFELLFAQTPNYAGKLIFIKKGHRLSLQYHQKKDETMYLYQGKMRLEIEDGGKMAPKTFEPGQSIRIPPHTRHRLKAIEDTTLFEVSTPDLDDVVRLEDDYGRAE